MMQQAIRGRTWDWDAPQQDAVEYVKNKPEIAGQSTEKQRLSVIMHVYAGGWPGQRDSFSRFKTHRVEDLSSGGPVRADLTKKTAACRSIQHAAAIKSG
jgi:hypothetical protein